MIDPNGWLNSPARVTEIATNLGELKKEVEAMNLRLGRLEVFMVLVVPVVTALTQIALHSLVH